MFWLLTGWVAALSPSFIQILHVADEDRFTQLAIDVVVLLAHPKTEGFSGFGSARAIVSSVRTHIETPRRYPPLTSQAPRRHAFGNPVRTKSMDRRPPMPKPYPSSDACHPPRDDPDTKLPWNATESTRIDPVMHFPVDTKLLPVSVEQCWPVVGSLAPFETWRPHRHKQADRNRLAFSAWQIAQSAWQSVFYERCRHPVVDSSTPDPQLDEQRRARK